LNKLGGFGVLLPKQGQSLIDGEQIVGWVARRRDVFVPLDPLLSRRRVFRFLAAGAVDEDARIDSAAAA